MNSSLSDGVAVKINLIKELGYDLSPQSLILDFGCGGGKRVQELNASGYQAFGCDFQFQAAEDADTENLWRKKIIRLLDAKAYVLPFEDNTFDFIFSEQVFEHVQNYSQTISEIERVLKPTGFCLHIFPSRYKPIEPHVYVPFSSIIGSYGWLYFWSMLGIRNEFQEGLSAKETAKRNYVYLRNNTNYLSKKKIVAAFKARFSDVIFCEERFLKCLTSRKGRYVYALSKVLRFLPLLYSAFNTRVVFTGGPRHQKK